jgi:DNA ligase-1
MPNWQRWKGIMKAYPFEEKRLLKWSPPFIIQPKYDGVRCRAVRLPATGKWALLSSEENFISSVPHINEALDSCDLSGFNELDGELYVHGWSFESIVSVTSRTVNYHPDYMRIQYHIFDTAEEAAQAQRITTLQHYSYLTHPLVISPFWLANNLQDVMQTFNELIYWGYEGIIVRNAFAPYERKRSLWVMKFKPKQEDQYTIVGYQEEISKDGNHKGTLGSLICDSGDNNTFSVGSGFSAADRADLWRVRDRLVGKQAKVQYQHITPGRKVPRFPVFVEVIK